MILAYVFTKGHKNYRKYNKCNIENTINSQFQNKSLWFKSNRLSLNVDKLISYCFRAKVKTVQTGLIFQLVVLKYLKHMSQKFCGSCLMNSYLRQTTKLKYKIKYT